MHPLLAVMNPPNTAEVAAWLAAGATAPALFIREFNRVIQRLDGYSIKSKVLRLNLLGGDDLTALRTPLIATKGAATDTATGLTYSDYSASRGFLNASTTKYLRTGATYTSGEVGGLAMWSSGQTAGGWYQMGARGTSSAIERSIVSIPGSTGTTYYTWAQQVTASASINGFHHLEVASTTSGKAYRNGSNVASLTLTNCGVTPEIYVGTDNLNGTPGSATGANNGSIGAYVITDGTMSATDAANLYTVISAYMTGIGRT